MNTFFNRTNKDTTASSVLLAAMFVLTATAFLSSGQATAKSATRSQQAFAAAQTQADEGAIVVTATRLVQKSRG